MRALALLVVIGTDAVAAERQFVKETGPLPAVGSERERYAPPPDTPGLEYPIEVYRGAAQLGLSRKFVSYVRQGLELLYHRQYRDCRTLFTELEATYPDTAVSAVADVLVWQAMMFENYDFKYVQPYEAASALAHTKLDAALDKPGADAWEHLMLGVVSGIDAIHAARNERYLPALTLAFTAIDEIESTRTFAPNFTDLLLADGLYNYWRTAITQRSALLPDFGDKKAEGLTQMRTVVEKGIFLVPPARLSLAFSYLDEKKYPDAIATLEANRVRYPDNVINDMLLGLTQLSARKPADALVTFDRVLVTDPTNRRSIYYRGRALHQLGRLDDAAAAYERYLALDEMEAWQRGAASWRLGDVRYAQKRYDDAERLWEAAAKLGDDSAKAALDRLRKARRDGTLPP